MDSKKSYIPIKVLLSYVVLIALIITVGWMLYSESKIFSATESKIAFENSKVLKVGNLLSNISQTESLARIAIQSNTASDFEKYNTQTTTLQSQIDSLKALIKSDYQIVLLDSVKLLLSKKTANIQELRSIKNQSADEIAVKKALTNIDKMQGSLRKLRIEDFVKDPSSLQPHQRRVWLKYVDYMNQNIPNDSTNTLSQKTLDSMLLASRTALSVVVKETFRKKSSLDLEEKKLLQNEVSISDQLRKILNIIEREIILSTSKSNAEKEMALQKTNEIVTYAAVAGFFLTVFFSLLIVSDFSKSQSYKKQLELAKAKTESLLRNREQLISTVSHDLKTPLSTIVGYAELLGNSALNKKQSYFTQNIKGSSEYISKLVQDLLDFTQIEAGKIAISTVPFSLNNTINEVAHSIQSVYAKKPIELIISTDKSLENRILGDPFRLRQILTNIIGNAFKFTESGFIKITAVANNPEGFVSITIEDSGIGIKKENLNLVFEEFTQADDSIEKRYGGTGLGLTISKKIIEILGGNLTLNSVFGKGSTFEMQFPLRFDDTIASKEIIAADLTTSLTAIVIDDDNNLLQLTTEVLKQKGFKVIPFSRASEAIDAIKTTTFDFVITDIQMPEMDGFLFLETLRNTPETQYRNQPVIAVTGSAEMNEQVYEDAGFAKLIKKPYSPSVLITTINGLFENSPSAFSAKELIEEKASDKPYCLKSLQSFLPENDHALKDVLLSFEETTKENLVALSDAIAKDEMPAIKEIAHRMGPMFRQIKADRIGKLLENMELKLDDLIAIKIAFTDLEQEIEALFTLLRKDSII